MLCCLDTVGVSFDTHDGVTISKTDNSLRMCTFVREEQDPEQDLTWQ